MQIKKWIVSFSLSKIASFNHAQPALFLLLVFLLFDNNEFMI